MTPVPARSFDRGAMDSLHLRAVVEATGRVEAASTGTAAYSRGPVDDPTRGEPRAARAARRVDVFQS